MTACSGASVGPLPKISRATAVCFGVVKYGCAPSACSPANFNIFGPRAASTRCNGVVGAAATYIPLSITSKYSTIAEYGFTYAVLCNDFTMLPWLAPMPKRKRSGNADVSVFWPACMVDAVRAYIDAMPVPTMRFFVADNKIPACAKGSRPTASGIHTVLKPNSSSSCTASHDWAIGWASSVHVQIPIFPSSSGVVMSVL